MTPIGSAADDYLEWMEIHNYAPGSPSKAEAVTSALSSPSPTTTASTRRRRVTLDPALHLGEHRSAPDGPRHLPPRCRPLGSNGL